MVGTKVMDLPYDAIGEFISRENRFLGVVSLREEGHAQEIKVHIHDPGRLSEILFPGNKVLLRKALGNSKRKTEWDLLAGMVEGEWVVANSSIHRHISDWALSSGILPFPKDGDAVLPERRLGDSRIDYLIMHDSSRRWVEVKGCSLKVGNVAMFPDAPTKRGTRHLRELARAVRLGDKASVIFLVFAPSPSAFSPNADTDGDFANAMRDARLVGVDVYSLLFSYSDGKIFYEGPVPAEI